MIISWVLLYTSVILVFDEVKGVIIHKTGENTIERWNKWCYYKGVKEESEDREALEVVSGIGLGKKET